jgi:hypothetical protein
MLPALLRALDDAAGAPPVAVPYVDNLKMMTVDLATSDTLNPVWQIRSAPRVDG